MTVQLYHGDALQVLPALASESVDLIITDPPYGAKRPSAWRSATDRFQEIPNNDKVFTDWLPECWRIAKDTSALYLFTCWQTWPQWCAAVSSCGWKVRSMIVWDKQTHGLADLNTCWAPQHELILFAAKGRHLLRGRRPKDILYFPRIPACDLAHPYEKPPGLLKHLLSPSSDPEYVIVDPFMGVGSTGVACVQMSRSFLGIEIDPSYFSLAQKRISQAQAQLHLPGI